MKMTAAVKATILTIFPPPGQAQAESRTAVHSSALPSIEAVILEKLLAELSTRDVARLQPPYLMEHPRSSETTRLLRALWSALWVLSIVLCVFIVKYFDNRTSVQTPDAAQIHSLDTLTATIGDQRQEFAKLINSLQGLTGVVAATSVRTAAIPNLLKRLGSGLKPPAPAEPAILAQPQQAILAQAVPAEPAEISLGGHHHAPMEYAVAPDGVVVHHNYLGVMDYWLIPRVISGARTMEKVVPVAQSNNGILVHDVAEIKDYIVTPAGDWIAASEPGQ